MRGVRWLVSAATLSAILALTSPGSQAQIGLDLHRVTLEGFGVGTTCAQIEARFGPGRKTASLGQDAKQVPLGTFYWSNQRLNLVRLGDHTELWGQRLEYDGRVLARHYDWPGGPLLPDPHPDDPPEARQQTVGGLQRAFSSGQAVDGYVIYRQDALTLRILMGAPTPTDDHEIAGFVLEWPNEPAGPVAP